MSKQKTNIRRNLAGIIFVAAAVVLLVTTLFAEAHARDTSAVDHGTTYDSEFLGGLWAAHDGPNSRTRNFFPFYYEAGEGGNSTWSIPILLSGGRIKADGSEEIRLFGGLIRHSIDKNGQ